MNNKMPDSGFAKQIKDKILNGEIKLDELDIAQLNELIDTELMLICHGQGDTELIDKCAEVINQKSGEDDCDDAFDSAIEKARQRVVVTDTITESKRILPGIKRIFILAATFITIVAMGLVLSSADYGMDIDKYLLEAVKGGPGTVINVGNYTFYCPELVKKYSSIDEFLENEGHELFYPTAFPNGHQLREVEISSSHRDTLCISFYSTDRDPNSGYCVLIEKNVPRVGDLAYDRVKYEKHGMNFYFETYDDRYRGCVMAFAFDGNDYYCITAKTYDELIYIIDNLRSTKE